MIQKPATIRAIAEAAGVSPSTVFRVMNEPNLVKPSTRAKVQAAQKFLETESPKEAGRNAVPTRSVGVIIPMSTAQNIDRHPSLFVIITSFLSEISNANIANTMLVFDENTMRGEDLLLRPMNGYLIIGTTEEQESLILPVLSRASLPCVMINRHADVPYISSVKLDDRAACADATRYLISLGHRRIVFLGGQKNYQHTKRRLEGYLDAMSEAALPVSEEWIFYGEYSENSGYTMGKMAEGLEIRPTAALCASDTIAIGCIHAMQEKGLSVPEDFSVVGFGDIESSRILTPALTTISQSSVEEGTIAARVLMQMMNSPLIVRDQLMLQTRMIVRSSTGAPPKTEGQ